MMKRVALITWAGLPQGTHSEQLLLPLLAQAGVAAEMVDWRDSTVDFSRFDLLVLRSCWDYHLHPQEFTAWLRAIARAVPVLNSAPTVLWNSDKTYLRELAARGLEIPPTCFVPAGTSPSRSDLEQMATWRQAVVKPAVSASAYNTRLLDQNALLSPDKFAEAGSGGAFLVQQFVPEIQTNGEISFIYIDGAYSHAVLKQAARGDFRVQKEFGGSAERLFPPAPLLQQTDQIVATVPQVRDSLYCRIDAFEKDGRLLLMELELIEPELFLWLADGAAEKLAEAILRRLSTPAAHILPL